MFRAFGEGTLQEIAAILMSTSLDIIYICKQVTWTNILFMKSKTGTSKLSCAYHH